MNTEELVGPQLNDPNDAFLLNFLFLVSMILIMMVYLVYYIPPWFMHFLVSNSHPQVFWCATTNSRVCALTIDDAPSESTNNVLDILAEYNVKATFFIIAGNIPGREDVMDRIVKEGHTLGNHLTDTRASIRDDLEIFERKLRECDHALRHYTQSNAFDEGKETKNHSDISMKWLRPASGWFTTRMREIVNKHGYYICLGSVYPHDAQIKVESLNAWYLRQRTRSGSIIILHDRSWTVGVLKSALPELVEKFKFVSLEELRFHHKRT